MYVVVALLRLRYPYELEWIEGGMVNHVAQLRSGQPLYGRTFGDLHAGHLHTAVLRRRRDRERVAGTGFVALRLVSIVASLVLLAALGQARAS